jgi:hypothetical protein
MWKRLVLWGKVGLAVLVIAIIVAMAGEYESARRKYQRECQSKVASVLSADAKKNQASSDECQDAKEYMPWGYVLISWPDGITLWALLATLAAIVYQGYHTRNAALGAIRAAEETKRSVDLTMHMQRARMAVVVKEADPFVFIIFGKNIGRGNARICYAKGFIVTMSGNQKLPESPLYLSEGVDNNGIIFWVAPERGISLDTGDNAEDLIVDIRDDAARNQIRLGNHKTWIYGRICYEDGISPEIREKRFCYYLGVEKGGKICSIAGGPHEYWMDT